MWFVLVTGFAAVWSALAVFAHLLRPKSGVDDPATSAAKTSLLAASMMAMVSYTFALPPLSTWMSASGMSFNWLGGIVIGNSVVIYVHMFYLFSVEDRPVAVRTARRVWLIYLVIVAAIIVLFAMIPSARDFDLGPDGRYRSGGAGEPLASLAYILSFAFAGAMNVVVCRLGWRWVKMAKGTPWVAMGLRTNAIGQILAMFMVAHMIGYNAALMCGVVPPWTQDLVETPIKGVAGLFTMLGLSATAAGRWIKDARLVVWAHDNSARRRMYPLWKRMVDVVPAIAIEPPPRSAFRDRLRVREPRRQLVDRILELWEGRQHIPIPYGTGELARRLGHADGLSGPELDAVVEAASLAVGFEVVNSPVDFRTELSSASEASRVVQDSKDTAAEVRWWGDVATALRTSPIVAQVRARSNELVANSTANGTGSNQLTDVRKLEAPA